MTRVLAIICLIFSVSTLSATVFFDDPYFVSPEDQTLMSILSSELPACDAAEMAVFDKFLDNKAKATMAKWGDNGIGTFEEYLDKVVVGMMGEYYSPDDPADQNNRETGCKNFVAYCNDEVSIVELNDSPEKTSENEKMRDYVATNYTSKGILAMACARGLEADLIACLTVDRSVDCDKTFFAQATKSK